ncbi:MAG: hypothetical protein KGJ38_08250 [Burkholderiaceae bacterium]|nr:hypothetical protein [Burkholderiaceae bacterium]
MTKKTCDTCKHSDGKFCLSPNNCGTPDLEHWEPAAPAAAQAEDAQSVTKAAQELLDAIDARHDTQPAPVKFSVPYKEVNALRAAIGGLCRLCGRTNLEHPGGKCPAAPAPTGKPLPHPEIAKALSRAFLRSVKFLDDSPTGDPVARCQHVLNLMDAYIGNPTNDTRHAIRSALMDMATITPPSTAALEAEVERLRADVQRLDAEAIQLSDLNVKANDEIIALRALLRQAREALAGLLSLDEDNHQRGADDEDLCQEVREAFAAIAAMKKENGNAG